RGSRTPPPRRRTTCDSTTQSTPSSCGPKRSSRAERRQIEGGVDQRGGTFEVVVAVDVLLHQERGAAVELLVLLMPAAELGSDEAPDEPHQRDPAPGIARG